MDFEQARFNMVEQQIRTWDVLDQRVLDLLFELRREEFVPPVYRALAFADLEIPLGDGERMWPPKLEARVVQELELDRNDAVLEIGTGSGYMTALLGRCSAAYSTCRRVATPSSISAYAALGSPSSGSPTLPVRFSM